MTSTDTTETGVMPAEALTIRDGLPNVGRKIEAGQPVTIAWIGGSITQAGNGGHGYVTRATRWLDEHYPDSEVRFVNAGISGTDSAFGAKRFDRDVLAHEPDLVLIEFSVNDGDRDHTRHIERMIHKAWLKDPRTDIAIFYTLADRHLPDYAEGNLPFVAACHERVAAHYGVPTIGTAKVIADRVNTGQITWDDFSNDGCHPREAGYAMFIEHLTASLPRLFEAGEPGDHALPQPLSPDFRVYPPRLEAKPFVAPPFSHPDLGEAEASFALPTFGEHWLGEPTFDGPDGKPLWRLAWMPRDKSTVDATCGLARRLWDGNEPSWFAEDVSFSAPSGGSLADAHHGHGNRIGTAQREAAVLVFIAPQTGRYAFRVHSSKIGVYQSNDKTFALNVAHFPWGKEQGQSVAFFSARKPDAHDLDLAGEVTMTAGEELALIHADNCPWYIGSGWLGLSVEIGYYGPAQ